MGADEELRGSVFCAAELLKEGLEFWRRWRGLAADAVGEEGAGDEPERDCGGPGGVGGGEQDGPIDRLGGRGGELRRVKQLEDEHRKLKQLVADLSLDKHILQDVLAKKL